MAIKVSMLALDSMCTNLQNAIEQFWVNHNLVCYKNRLWKTLRQVEGSRQALCLRIGAYSWSSPSIELDKKKRRDDCNVAAGANYSVASPLSWELSLRYVGVIWFIFHVLQLLPIWSMQQNLCCIRVQAW